MGVNNYSDTSEGATRATQRAPASPPPTSHDPLRTESEHTQPTRPAPSAQSAIAKADARASKTQEDPAAPLRPETASEGDVAASRGMPMSRAGGREHVVSETHGTVTGHASVPHQTTAAHTVPIEGTPSRVQPNFIRRRAPHHTQDAIDDIAQDGNSIGEYTHDSNVSIRGNVRGGAFTGMPYRRARSGIDQVKSGKYGRYLEIPKGRRSIFVSQEQQKRRRSALSLVGIIVFLVIALLIIWRLIASVTQ